jgi:DNA-binding Lrp family transcriptional regulator
MPKVDVVDFKILKLLRSNARISNVRLADEIGLSPSACLRRLRLLERSGVIRGYAAIIDDKRMERTAAVIVQITLAQQTADYLNRFESAVRKCSDVAECYLMSGKADYLLRVEAKDTADYERIHKEQLSVLPGVARIHSSFTIRQVLPSRA